MSAGTTLSRLSGFIRLLAAAYALGINRLSDAYNLANTTPNIVYDLVLGGILSSVFVPVLVEWVETKGREAAWRSARTLVTFTTLFLGAIAALGVLGAGVIVRVYTVQDHGPGTADYRALATFFLIWFMPQVVFYGIGAVWTGVLNADRRFGAPMFAPIVNNLLGIATFLAFAVTLHHAVPTESNLTNVQRLLLALGTTGGVLGMTLALWPSLRAAGFRWRFRLELRDEAFLRILRLTGWIVVYVAANQIGYLVVVLLSNRTEGWYTTYSYAYIFFQLPFAIVTVSLFTALLPELASMWTAEDRAGFAGIVAKGLGMTVFVLFPAAAVSIAVAGPAMRLFVQHGFATASDADLLARTLAGFAVGLVPFSVFQLLVRAFSAMQDSRTPALVNAAAVALNVAADLVLVRVWGVVGLALGQTIAYTAAAVVGGLILQRRVDGRKLAGASLRSGVALLPGVASGLAALLVIKTVPLVINLATLGAQVVQVGVALLAAGLALWAVAKTLRLDELSSLSALVSYPARRR